MAIVVRERCDDVVGRELSREVTCGAVEAADKRSLGEMSSSLELILLCVGARLSGILTGYVCVGTSALSLTSAHLPALFL